MQRTFWMTCVTRINAFLVRIIWFNQRNLCVIFNSPKNVLQSFWESPEEGSTLHGCCNVSFGNEDYDSSETGFILTLLTGPICKGSYGSEICSDVSLVLIDEDICYLVSSGLSVLDPFWNEGRHWNSMKSWDWWTLISAQYERARSVEYLEKPILRISDSFLDTCALLKKEEMFEDLHSRNPVCQMNQQDWEFLSNGFNFLNMICSMWLVTINPDLVKNKLIYQEIKWSIHWKPQGLSSIL